MRMPHCLPALAVALLSNLTATAYAQDRDQREDTAIDWQTGPVIGRLGDQAQIHIPERYSFAGQRGVRTFMESNQNPVSGQELGVVVPPQASGANWFVVFRFTPIGYVRDDEKDDLDREALLDSIRNGTARANEERRRRGWAPVEVLGWHSPPRYDSITNNLTWAVRGASNGHEGINYSVRLLGRRGVMRVDLVLEAADVAGTVASFNKLLSGFAFTPGNKYAEFRPGDRIAEYGLTALVAGGVGAAAAKSGVLGKFWKLLIFGAVAAIAALKKMLQAVFARSDYQEPETPSAAE